MTDTDFFKEATPRSLVKINIVSKYFWSWAKALKNTVSGKGDKLTFIDLYSGPGFYSESGELSTPLRVLEAILRNPDLCKLVATRFNDIEPEYCETLKSAIEQMPGITSLQYPPVISNEEVSQDLVNRCLRDRPGPILLFLDPFGYKGLSLDLIWSVVQTFGSDCIFFFNYRRVNAGLPNHFLDEPIDALFTKVRADALREKIAPLSVDGREQAIIDEITAALKEKGAEFIHGYRFNNDAGTRTSHFLIFVTKKSFALGLMKSIMAKESSALGSEVPSYEFNPAKEKKIKSEQSQTNMLADLFGAPKDEIDILCEDLLQSFSGRSLAVQQIYFEHHAGKLYVESNYKNALLRMEEKGQIICEPSSANRQKRLGKGTLGKDVLITFPQKGV